MNLLNYVDRYVFASLGPALTADGPRGLALTDGQFGKLGASFMVVYAFVSPVVGWLGDRYDRRRLMAFGVALWSLATVATAFARDYSHMFAARAVLGVGEASYGVVAPALLADLFGRKARGRGDGAVLPRPADRGGARVWDRRAGRGPLRLAGGLLGRRPAGAAGRAAWGLMIRDPGRGASEGVAAGPVDAAPRPVEIGRPAGMTGDLLGRGGAAENSPVEPVDTPPGPGGYGRLLRTPSYLLNIGGMAAVTFTTGAYAHWAPIFLQPGPRACRRTRPTCGSAC